MNKNQGEKWKLNAVLEKENTRWTIRVKNRVFLAMKNKYMASKRNLLGSNHLLQQTKQKNTESKSKYALRKMHRIWSNKNIVCWKVTWFLPMKKGCLGGIPKLWRLYLLDISWGDMGIPKLELLSILYLISSFSNPYTWKLPSYKTSHNSISNVSINIIVNQPFLVQFKTQEHHI
jgi:hypothetical protein